MTRPTQLPERPAVLISTYLEPELVERLRQSLDVEMLYAPELLPAPRYGNDHGGTPPTLSPAQEHRWLQLLTTADVAFDFDWRDPAQLLTNVPHLMSCQREHHWERHVMGQLAGRRATIVGLGSIGRQVAAAFNALGVHVTGVGRSGRAYDLPAGVASVAIEKLDDVLGSTDILVLAVPLTAETENLIDASRVAALPEGAIVVNVARGQVIDEAALTEALMTGSLGGAALDVFEVEPLPAGSPLWDLPNVLISPHSASIAAVENEVLTDLFIENFRRLRAGEPLRNLYDSARGY